MVRRIWGREMVLETCCGDETRRRAYPTRCRRGRVRTRTTSLSFGGPARESAELLALDRAIDLAGRKPWGLPGSARAHAARALRVPHGGHALDLSQRGYVEGVSVSDALASGLTTATSDLA